MRRLALSVLVLTAALLPLPGRAASVPTSVPTDYDAELARIQKDIAEIEGTAFATPVDLEKATKYAFLVYRRASLTSDFADFKAAETAIDRTLELIGPSEDVLLLKANFDFKLHRLARAKAGLEMVPDLANGPGARALQADLALQEGRYEEARKGYETALRKKKTWDNMARLAYLKAKTGDPDGAEKLYVAAQDEITAKEMRSYAWVELQRGLIDLDRRRYKDALEHYQKADRAYSGYWQIQEHIAEVLNLLGRTEESIALYRDIIARTHNPEFVSALAMILARRDPAAAADLLREADGLFAEQSRLYPEAAIGHYLKHLIDRPGAAGPELLEMARQNVALRPNGESKLLLARAYLKLQRPADAKAQMDEILATPWRTPEVERLEKEVRAGLRRPTAPVPSS
jgi:tetratricopeptide (TPR) repeat protein